MPLTLISLQVFMPIFACQEEQKGWCSVTVLSFSLTKPVGGASNTKR